MATLGQLIDDLSDAQAACIEEGNQIKEIVVCEIPKVLDGAIPFEESELKYLLDVMCRPEKRESLGWNIIERQFTDVMKKMFHDARDTEIAKKLFEYIWQNYHYDIINNE